MLNTYSPVKGKLNPEGVEKVPLFHITHRFANMNFLNICNGILYKNFWETKRQFTSIAHVQQVDDDRVVVWRRHVDWCNIWALGYERIIFNRANKTVETSYMAMNPDGSEYQIEKTTVNEDGQLNQIVYDVQGNREGRLDMLKYTIQ